MTSHRRVLAPGRLLVRLAAAPVVAGGVAWGSEFSHMGLPSDPATEAGCAPVVEWAKSRPDELGCTDLPCDAIGDARGDCCTRQTLLGDCGGLRSGLTESGVTVFFDVTQVYQGVTAGGLQQTWDSAATAIYC